MANKPEESPGPSIGPDAIRADPALDGLISGVDASSRQWKQVMVDLARLQREGQTTDPFRVTRCLERVQLSLDATELRSMCSDLLTRFKVAAKDALMRLDADIRDECARNDWKLDGQWPKFYIQRVIRVEIDEAAGQVIVGDTVVPSAAISTISAAIQLQNRELLPKTFQSAQFLSALSGAHDRIVTREQAAVPIWLLYREMLLSQQPKTLWRTGRSDAFRTYTEQRFRASLTRVLQEGKTRTPDGRDLRLLPALRAEEGMYLYEPLEQRFAFVGRVGFTSTGDDRRD